MVSWAVLPSNWTAAFSQSSLMLDTIQLMWAEDVFYSFCSFVGLMWKKEKTGARPRVRPATVASLEPPGPPSIPHWG